MIHDEITLLGITDEGILAVVQKELETSYSLKRDKVPRHEKIELLGKST